MSSREKAEAIALSLPHLSLSEVSIRFDGAAVLSNISLQLERGEIGCLLGPSGCGKTTLLRAIAGFDSIAAGRIELDGRQLASAASAVAAQKRRIGMVFQDCALFPHLNVLKNILFGLHDMPAPQACARAEKLLQQVGLSGREAAMPHQLSGGEQQRVALARALAPAPALLLLDEPFSNLDLDLRESLGRELREILKQSQTTALMVTHDQYEAFAVADSIGVIHNGGIEQWGSAYDIYHQPASAFIADFVGQGVFLHGEMVASDEVETCLGRFHLSAQAPYRDGVVSGTSVRVLFRPDDIIHDDASPLRAVVEARYFRGAEFLYKLKLHNGESLLALVPSHHDHAVGEAIGIRLEVDHVVVFN